MPNAMYTISTRQSGSGGADLLVYSEGDERSIEFSCRTAVKPVPVWIPLGRWWSERAPPWAQARRDIIVERVRNWGALVYEALLDAGNNTLTTIRSPDGTFRVECLEEFDDRAPDGNERASSQRPATKSLSTCRCMALPGRSNSLGRAR